MTRLDELDLTRKLSRREQERLLGERGARLGQLRLALGGQLGGGELGPALCVLLEGWDASGKGGAIKRLVAPLDARHARVVSFSAPSPDELRHHYLHRRGNPLKAWKLTDEDWRNRAKRGAYEAAVEDMLTHTDTEWAPWRLIEGDSKRWARVRVMETVIAAIEEGCAKQSFPLPEPFE